MSTKKNYEPGNVDGGIQKSLSLKSGVGPRNKSIRNHETEWPTEIHQGAWIRNADNKDLIAILDNLPCGITLLGSPLGRVFYINREILATLGYSLDSVPSTRDMLEKAIPSQKARRENIRMLKQVLKSGRGANIFPLICKDGKKRTFEITTIVMRKNLILNTWIDVTRREAAEKRLHESESRFRSFFEQSVDPFLLFDGANLINCNLAAQGLFKYQNTFEMVGKTLEALSPEKQADGRLSIKKTVSLFKSAKKNGNHRTEWTIQARDGKNIPVELSITAIILEEKNLFFVVLRDITPWKEAQAVLLNAKTELECAVKTRTSEFTALNWELMELSEHLQQAREDERIRIARDVHDHVGQFLTGLKMNLIYQAQNPSDDAAVRMEQTKSIAMQIDRTIMSVKDICSELRPSILGHFGLTAAVQWYLEDFQKRTGVRCNIKLDSEIPALNKDLAVLLFRIFQELMVNVLRHARATKVSIWLKYSAGAIMLKVKDNGRGILIEEVSHPRSFGIIGIRERVRFWGGQSKFKGASNKGTTVTILLPLNQSYKSPARSRYGLEEKNKEQME